MRARSIDGKALARERQQALAERVQRLTADGVTPCLAALGVGADPAWDVYCGRQAKACTGVGVAHRRVDLPAESVHEDLIEAVEALNADEAVHGIIIQAPLDPAFDLFQAQSLISPIKDVEGVGPANLGLIMAGRHEVVPCTARSAYELARHALGELRGLEAVVVGSSVIVGKPVAELLLGDMATVRVCHIATRDLAAATRDADLVVVAVGKPDLITADMVKPGATVIDVGINRVPGPDGKRRVVGDVAADVWEVAGAVSPVPGGVGAMTTTILLEQTVAAAERLARETPAIAGDALSRLLAGEGVDVGPEMSGRLARILSSHLVAGSERPARSLLERRLQRQVLVLDGGVGTELIRRGIPPERIARANLDAPDAVLAVHRAYKVAGAEALTTNTFAANRFVCGDREVAERLAQAGVRLARQAAGGEVFVFGSLGPLGPVVGVDIDTDTAADAYAEIALAMADAGVDALMPETMPSIAEAAAAVRGIRRISRLPIVVSRAYEGDDPIELDTYARAMAEVGADVIGLNCVPSPHAARSALARLAAVSALPVMARPNAGFPRREHGELVYDMRPQWLVRQAEAYLAAGVRLVGGCCGVGPDHIRALAAACGGRTPIRPAPAPLSATPAVEPAALASHPYLDDLRHGRFPVMALIAGRLPVARIRSALADLDRAGVGAVGVLTGWPGSMPPGRLPALLRHIQDGGQAHAVLELNPGTVTLREAQDLLLAAHLLDVRLILVDGGIFTGTGRHAASGAAVDPLRMLELVQRLNAGEDLAGNRLEEATAFTCGIRLGPETIHRVEACRAAGAAFVNLQPIYDPRRFRRAMAELGTVLPVVAEVLVLGDAETADAIDNEVPQLSVPERLKRRLAQDPVEDVAGVVRFLDHWRGRLAGLCLLQPDAHTAPAQAVLQRLAGAAADRG